MSRRLAALLIAASGLVILVALLLLSGRSRQRDGERGGHGDSATSAESGETETFDLYFPGPGGLLHVEQRRLATTKDPLVQARLLVEALVAGPENESLRGPFPSTTEVRAIDPGPNGSLYVSLVSSPLGPPHRFDMGSRGELLTLYSLVDSVAYNIEGVERVAILWNGVQPATLAGHVDTSRPLAPSRTWLAR